MTNESLNKEKRELLEWLAGINDPDTITALKVIKNSLSEQTMELTEHQKRALDKGLRSLAQHELIPHDEVIADLKKQYPGLF